LTERDKSNEKQVIENRKSIEQSNESNADVAIHVNVDINKTFNRLSTIEERVKQMK
jgi:hypothetical protein